VAGEAIDVNAARSGCVRELERTSDDASTSTSNTLSMPAFRTRPRPLRHFGFGKNAPADGDGRPDQPHLSWGRAPARPATSTATTRALTAPVAAIGRARHDHQREPERVEVAQRPTTGSPAANAAAPYGDSDSWWSFTMSADRQYGDRASRERGVPAGGPSRSPCRSTLSTRWQLRVRVCCTMRASCTWIVCPGGFLGVRAARDSSGPTIDNAAGRPRSRFSFGAQPCPGGAGGWLSSRCRPGGGRDRFDAVERTGHDCRRTRSRWR